jgi:Uma2 family endonuclease
MATQPVPTRYTLEEFHRLAHDGLLDDLPRVELLFGRVVAMSPVGLRHKACVSRLTRLMVRHYLEQAIVYVQNPLVVGPHELLPDLVVLRPNPTDYADRHAQASDALLVIEVSDTTLKSDQTVKVPLYAQYGVPQVWVIDLNQQQVWVYQQSAGAAYQQVTVLESSGILELPELGVAIGIRELLGS